jgi:hypothetical protein
VDDGGDRVPAGTHSARALAADRPVEANHAYQAALRCGECHGEIQRQWKTSLHAKATESALYQALLGQAHDSDCEGCHYAPGLSSKDGDPIAKEGVTCDVCHALSEVVVRDTNAEFHPRPEDNVRYGPLCDARDHYFHKMGCSPMHERSTMCAACHHWAKGVPGEAPLFLLGEFKEWSESKFARGGVECQDCHMPGDVTPVAVGSRTRVEVPDHGFMGSAADLRRRAVSLNVSVEPIRTRDAIVHVTITNDGAGHAVPTGLPERCLVLRVLAKDGDGVELARQERTYEKILTDASDRRVLFFDATRMRSDTRLQAGESRKETFEFQNTAATEVLLELTWHDLAPELAERVEGYESRGELIFERKVPFSRAGARAGSLRTGRP